VNEEDLFVKLDPAMVAAVAGRVEGVAVSDAYKPGWLLQAALQSRHGPTVLLLDEWDKTLDRADALLLQFLQDGTVGGPFGEVWTADKNNLIVILTSNEFRPLAEPLLRRCYRYRLTYLPPEVEADILRKESGLPASFCRQVVKVLTIVRTRGESSPSLQEALNFVAALGRPPRPTTLNCWSRDGCLKRKRRLTP
ncbi:MAG: hypothetical protein RMI91_15415, partial [Gemmatales bacterium]|nr:hypothetical protein [Gemmatales bacterium]